MKNKLTHQEEFRQALQVAEDNTQVAVEAYCGFFDYTGSLLVGERLSNLGYPDYICFAAEIVCETADDAGEDPRSLLATGAVSPEHIAANLGWFKTAPVSGKQLAWLEKRGVQDSANFFIHPSDVAKARLIGLRTEAAKPCYSFKPEGFPCDPPEGSRLYRTPGAACPTVCVIGEEAYADPVNVLHGKDMESMPEASLDGWTSFQIDSLPLQVRRTGGDGLFLGVAVDTGLLVKFPFQQGAQKLQIQLRAA
jgi:hypothetical protein